MVHELLGPGDLDAQADAWMGRAGLGFGLARFGIDSKDDILRDGGPFGFGHVLMPGGQGAAGWDNPHDDFHPIQSAGDRIIAFGTSIIRGVQDTYPELEITGSAFGGFTVEAGLIVWTAGAFLEKLYTPAPQPEPKPEPEPEPEPAPGPDPDPDDESGLYPDPYGGGGNPTTIWDGDGGVGPTTIWDGDGGVSPTTIWDENGGGGNPATIWDENGGGVAPNAVQGIALSARVITGPGLEASAIQVGPRTFA